MDSDTPALGLPREEDVVMVLDKNVAMVMVLVLALEKNVVLALEEDVVLALEETVACIKEPWGSGHTGPCPEYLHVQGPACLLLQVVLALEEVVVCTKNHPARRHYTRGGVHRPWDKQGAGGGKSVSKDTNRGSCQRRA